MIFYCFFIVLLIQFAMFGFCFKLNLRKSVCCRLFSRLPQSQCGPTVKNIYLKSIDFLTSHAVVDAECSARYLICHATNIGYKQSDFNSNLSRQLTPTEVQLVQNYCERRSRSEPVQYILGNWEFFGHEIECLPPILIPRPETEELVGHILSSLENSGMKCPRILDIGCGSGVIGLSLTKAIPGSTCVGIDINADAIDLTRRNAQRILGVTDLHRYHCIHTGFDKCVEGLGSTYNNNNNNDDDKDNMKFDLIVSNPPYIPSRELAGLQPEVRLYEDRIALDGGADGLSVVREIFSHCHKLFRHDTPCAELWLELDPSHPPMISHALESSSDASAESSPSQQSLRQSVEGWQLLSTIRDLGNMERFVRMRSIKAMK